MNSVRLGNRCDESVALIQYQSASDGLSRATREESDPRAERRDEYFARELQMTRLVQNNCGARGQMRSPGIYPSADRTRSYATA
jgi:hypothetical protein